MPVMFLGKLTCVESKYDVILHVQPRTPYVKLHYILTWTPETQIIIE